MEGPRVYLAGPEVFLPDPLEMAARKKRICADAGLHGVFPMDEVADEPADWAGLPRHLLIFRRNVAHIRRCAGCIANLTPFRGPSADAGTVWEVGYFAALGRPVFAYANVAVPFAARSIATTGAERQADGTWRDSDGMSIEAFGLFDNLMIDGGVLEGGGVLLTAEVAEDARWQDLGVFARAVEAAAQSLRQS
jgi:nucleoside 2-deoxyribosyltransferase